MNESEETWLINGIYLLLKVQCNEVMLAVTHYECPDIKNTTKYSKRIQLQIGMMTDSSCGVSISSKQYEKPKNRLKFEGKHQLQRRFCAFQHHAPWRFCALADLWNSQRWRSATLPSFSSPNYPLNKMVKTKTEKHFKPQISRPCHYYECWTVCCLFSVVLLARWLNSGGRLRIGKRLMNKNTA